MFKDTAAFSGFSVNDLAAAKAFYGEKLGLGVDDSSGMGLQVTLGGGAKVFVYAKDDHVPATFTILNFSVKDVDVAVKQLTEADIELEHYNGLTGDDGIARGLAAKRGPDIAWFKDPAGNILSVLQEP